MANYYCTSRTNYFRVTDENAYAELFKSLCSENGVEDFTETDENGVIWHGFGSYGTIDYCEQDKDGNYDDPDFDLFAKQLQEILPDDEAFVLLEVGNEKLRYVTGYAIIITKNNIRSIDLTEVARNECKKLLGADFKTKMEY